MRSPPLVTVAPCTGSRSPLPPWPPLAQNLPELSFGIVGLLGEQAEVKTAFAQLCRPNDPEQVLQKPSALVGGGLLRGTGRSTTGSSKRPAGSWEEHGAPRGASLPGTQRVQSFRLKREQRLLQRD